MYIIGCDLMFIGLYWLTNTLFGYISSNLHYVDYNSLFGRRDTLYKETHRFLYW